MGQMALRSAFHASNSDVEICSAHLRFVAIKKPHVHTRTSGLENPELRTRSRPGNKLIFLSRDRRGFRSLRRGCLSSRGASRKSSGVCGTCSLWSGTMCTIDDGGNSVYSVSHFQRLQFVCEISKVDTNEKAKRKPIGCSRCPPDASNVLNAVGIALKE